VSASFPNVPVGVHNLQHALVDQLDRVVTRIGQKLIARLKKRMKDFFF